MNDDVNFREVACETLKAFVPKLARDEAVTIGTLILSSLKNYAYRTTVTDLLLALAVHFPDAGVQQILDAVNGMKPVDISLFSLALTKYLTFKASIHVADRVVNTTMSSLNL